MTPKQVAVALMQWADATIPELAQAYDHATEGKAGFPDIGVEFSEIEHTDVVGKDERLPFEQSIEQTGAVLYRTMLLLVVDAELGAQAASDKLYQYANDLAVVAKADRTLGGRVVRISRRMRFDFHPDAPFIEFDDGSKGRRMTMHLVVSDPSTPK